MGREEEEEMIGSMDEEEEEVIGREKIIEEELVFLIMFV
jgi:hypothetical protein